MTSRNEGALLLGEGFEGVTLSTNQLSLGPGGDDDVK